MNDLAQLRSRLQVARDCGHPATAVMLSKAAWVRMRAQHIAETGAWNPTPTEIVGAPIRLVERFDTPVLVYD